MQSYGFQLDRDRIREGNVNIEDVFRRFKASSILFLDNIWPMFPMVYKGKINL